MKRFDERLMYNGRHFATIDGFLHEIALDFDLEESQLEAIAEQLRREGNEELLTRPDVLADVIKNVDERTYVMDERDLEAVCNGDCGRHKEETFLVDEDVLEDVIRQYRRGM
jgi:hypothetical protein